MTFKKYLNEKYSSEYDTKKHIEVVARYLNVISNELLRRAEKHDSSKLESPEKEIFDEYTPKLKTSIYGSEEYKSFLKNMKPALDHHYKNNSHHPEHYSNGISDMNLVDIIEMICDWLAATKRHENGDIKKSLEINSKRFELDSQLQNILKNTVTLIEKD